jgi:hypothetical protein
MSVRRKRGPKLQVQKLKYIIPVACTLKVFTAVFYASGYGIEQTANTYKSSPCDEALLKTFFVVQIFIGIQRTVQSYSHTTSFVNSK